MIGRITNYGRVVRWEPLGSGMCDALLELDGKLMWHASHTLKPADGLPPHLPKVNKF